VAGQSSRVRAQSLPQSWWPARRSPDPSVPPSSPIGRPRGERARTCPATRARYPGRGLPAVARDGLGSEIRARVASTPACAVAGPTNDLSRFCLFGLAKMGISLILTPIFSGRHLYQTIGFLDRVINLNTDQEPPNVGWE
jgi:hypothetical protein